MRIAGRESEGIDAETVVLYSTAYRAEFLSDPRVIIREIESLQSFASKMGWKMVCASNMGLSGVFYDPATSDKFQRPMIREGFRAAIATSADVIAVHTLGRLATSLGSLADVLHEIEMAGKRLAVVDGNLMLDVEWLQRIRDVIPLSRQTHGGRIRVAKGVFRLPGRPAKSAGRLPAYETTEEIDGASVRVPDFKVLRELARADQLRLQGLSWADVADQLENELAAAENRPPLDEDPILIDRYIRKCSRSLHTADWDFRKFIAEHSFNRPEGKISRRWTKVRLRRILDEHRPRLDAWLHGREMVLVQFLNGLEGSATEGAKDVSDVVGNPW